MFEGIGTGTFGTGFDESPCEANVLWMSHTKMCGRPFASTNRSVANSSIRTHLLTALLGPQPLTGPLVQPLLTALLALLVPRC